jgi:ribonuclease P protein component
MSISKSFSLGKSERLKSRKQIDILFESGKKITQFPLRLIYRTETPVTGQITEKGKSAKAAVKAGFTVSSKNFPKAVDRNRIKRLIREAYRLKKNDLEGQIQQTGTILHLFFIYTGREMVSLGEITTRLNQLLDKLRTLLHDSHISNT